jgi:hypothetical protein
MLNNGTRPARISAALIIEGSSGRVMSGVRRFCKMPES